MYENDDYNIYDDYAAINRELNIGSARDAQDEDDGTDRSEPLLPLKVAVPKKKLAPVAAPEKAPAPKKRAKAKKAAPATPDPADHHDDAAAPKKASSAAPVAHAIIAFVLGIVGFVFCLPPVGTALGIIGLVFGIKALAKRTAAKAKAIIGVVFSALALLASLGIAYYIYYNQIYYDIESFISDYYGYGAYSDDDYDYYDDEDEDYYDDTDYYEDDTSYDYSPDARAALNDGDEPTEYLVGESIDDDGLDIVYMASGYLDPAKAVVPPEAGMKYIFLEFGCENYSNEERTISAVNFTCYYDGILATAYTDEKNVIRASLPPEGTTVGRIYFSIPDEAQAIAVEYSYAYASAPGERSVFVFTGEQSAGFTFGENPYDEPDDTDYSEDDEYYEDEWDDSYDDYEYEDSEDDYYYDDEDDYDL